MSTAAAFAPILGALLVGAISPGPSFMLVSRIAATQSRLHGLAAAAGMGVGGTLFAALALLGLAALLNQVGPLHVLLRLAGGAYLAWLGFRMWRGASRPLAPARDTARQKGTFTRALVSATATQLSNPKTAVVYGSIFAAMLPTAGPPWLLAALPPMIFALEAGWYALVALAFSAARPRALYLRGRTWIDRLAGGVMSLLGVRLVADALAAYRL